MRIDEYRSFDALGLAELVKAGEVTSSELLDVARRQAETSNSRLNSIIRFMDAEADRRVTEELVGPFAGVPFLIKDIAQDYAGLPSSNGSRSLARIPALEHSTVVRRWIDPDSTGCGWDRTVRAR